VLDTFKPKARLAFIMVRELEMSSQDVAHHLGIEKSVVRWYVAAVQRRFWWALLEIGIRAPSPRRGTVPKRNTVVANDSQLRIVEDSAAARREVA